MMVGRKANRKCARSESKSSKAEIKFPTGRITRKVKNEIAKFISAVANDNDLSKLFTKVAIPVGKAQLMGKLNVISKSLSSATAVQPARPARKSKAATKRITTRPKKQAKKVIRTEIRNNQVGETTLIAPAQSKCGSSLDLVFAIDCTTSMGPYIANMTKNIRSIVDEIIKNDTCDIQLALIEYREYPSQGGTFVTRVHPFTTNVNDMEGWLRKCEQGDRGTAAAIGCALSDAVHLYWRAEATKIYILIADAPPHGLDLKGDTLSNGRSYCHDPIIAVRKMAEKHITLYAVGVEPPIVPYRDFFMSLVYVTGGRYVPLVNIHTLAEIIVGSVHEQIQLEQLMYNAQQDIAREMQLADTEGVVDDRIKAIRMKRVIDARGEHVHQLQNAALVTSDLAIDFYSKCANIDEMQKRFLAMPPLPTTIGKPTAGEDIDVNREKGTIINDQAMRIVQKLKRRK